MGKITTVGFGLAKNVISLHVLEKVRVPFIPQREHVVNLAHSR